MSAKDLSKASSSLRSLKSTVPEFDSYLRKTVYCMRVNSIDSSLIKLMASNRVRPVSPKFVSPSTLTINGAYPGPQYRIASRSSSHCFNSSTSSHLLVTFAKNATVRNCIGLKVCSHCNHSGFNHVSVFSREFLNPITQVGEGSAISHETGTRPKRVFLCL
jgi:hypothetical protein